MPYLLFFSLLIPALAKSDEEAGRCVIEVLSGITLWTVTKQTSTPGNRGRVGMLSAASPSAVPLKNPRGLLMSSRSHDCGASIILQPSHPRRDALIIIPIIYHKPNDYHVKLTDYIKLAQTRLVHLTHL